MGESRKCRDCNGHVGAAASIDTVPESSLGCVWCCKATGTEGRRVKEEEEQKVFLPWKEAIKETIAQENRERDSMLLCKSNIMKNVRRSSMKEVQKDLKYLTDEKSIEK